MDRIKTVVVGCGDRACVYAEEGVFNLQSLEIVAAVDPDKVRLQYMQDHFGVKKEMCFEHQEDLLKLGRIADCVINGTMDQYHLETSIPFLEQGYHMLLEKPIVNNEKDLLYIRDVADEHHCKLMICHVLRFTPFYKKIKEMILNGEIGEVVSIETSERVGVFHSSVAFVRGKWNKESECGSSLLLAKCCHDMDLLCWLNNVTVPEYVSSFGGRDFIIPEKAPKGAGTRCLIDCPEEVRKKCIYDVQSMYLDNCHLPWYPWQCTGKNYQDVTMEEKIESLKTYNPHGVCAYKAGGDLVDHQVVNVEFANGSTAVHSMILGCAKPGRKIWIVGTEGEIEGSPDQGILEISKYSKKTAWFDTVKIDFNDRAGETGGHFGGDKGLVADFCRLMKGEEPSISCTSIDDSINGHRLVYKAEEARKEHRVVKM